MQKLIQEVHSIPNEIKQVIDQRMKEFSSFSHKSSEDWFSELCFCLLTANSRAKTAMAIQKELGFNGFYSLQQEKLVDCIKANKHRFHNTKAARIVEARTHKNIKSTMQNIVKTEGQNKAREWLVKNIKGLGFKESSHFLRNTGHEDLAIIDRHILSILTQHNLIQNPITVSPKNYLEIESACSSLAKQLDMSLSKLDLCLWYLKTGTVLK